MNVIESPRGEKSPSRLGTWAVLGCGIALTIVSGASWVYSSRTREPGRLVPKVDLATWRSPLDEKIRSSFPEEAQASFEVVNSGGRPVNILEVQTSCGCAAATVEPTWVQAGRSSIVSVKATPLQIGERMVQITLKTDSPVRPLVHLRLKIVGSRRPPFLAKSGGDLSFGEKDSPSETRTLYAFNAESKGSKPLPPSVTAEAPFIMIAPARLIEEHATADPDTVSRKYGFEVSISADRPSQSYSGELRVVDPWDANHVERERLHFTAAKSLKSIPDRLALKAAADPGALGDGGGKFIIISSDSAPDLTVQPEGLDENAIQVELLGADLSHRVGTYRATVKQEIAKPGDYKILVRNPSTGESLVVPVKILVDGKD